MSSGWKARISSNSSSLNTWHLLSSWIAADKVSWRSNFFSGWHRTSMILIWHRYKSFRIRWRSTFYHCSEDEFPNLSLSFLSRDSIFGLNHFRKKWHLIPNLSEASLSCRINRRSRQIFDDFVAVSLKVVLIVHLSLLWLHENTHPVSERMRETAFRSIELILVFISESHIRKRWIFMSFQSVREMMMIRDIVCRNSLSIGICSVFLSFACLVQSSFLRGTNFHKRREKQRNWNFLGKKKKKQIKFTWNLLRLLMNLTRNWMRERDIERSCEC